MTPNDSHLHYAKFFAEAGLPVWVEKPPAISIAELYEFVGLARKYPNLVFSAEYSNDGRCLPLFWISDSLDAKDPRLAYLRTEGPDARILYKELGNPIGIDGAILEGIGTAGTADHRHWLLDGRQGGMIRDLSSHLFGVLYDIGLATNDVLSPRVGLGKYDKGMGLGTWRPLASPDEGETYANIAGAFAIHPGLVTFRFRVDKYWPTHERYLKIAFENGSVSFSYEKPFELVMKGDPNGCESRVWLDTDFYPSVAFLDFKRFLEQGGGGHIDRGAAIVRFNETMRSLGVVS